MTIKTHLRPAGDQGGLRLRACVTVGSFSSGGEGFSAAAADGTKIAFNWYERCAVPKRDTMEDRRKSQRGPAYLAAQIAFSGRASTIDCLVRNLSSQGAKITFGDGAAIPAEFEVTIPRRSETRRAHIMWRNETQAGIHFLEADRDVTRRRVAGWEMADVAMDHRRG